MIICKKCNKQFKRKHGNKKYCPICKEKINNYNKLKAKIKYKTKQVGISSYSKNLKLYNKIWDLKTYNKLIELKGKYNNYEQIAKELKRPIATIQEKITAIEIIEALYRHKKRYETLEDILYKYKNRKGKSANISKNMILFLKGYLKEDSED